ncbi:extracellular solute-binding protein [Lapidilactobacillus achengensis]|uniref:Extracellular solute-binding protein n=1 Tax=Lapidilactobacillus achengensis TaxID=2486000 RepID=A0ABW1ULS7_9LACO|nr:extracellular solute-binding protein [Lapidilactobacillus achengensis]
MKMGLKFAAVAVTALMLLAGCANNKVKGKASGGHKKDEKIVVYSNSVANGRGDFLKEKAKEKGFDLEIVDLGGNDLLNRVMAEKDAPIADVVFGMNQMMFNKVEKTGILETYQPKWLDQVDPALVNKQHKFSPLQEQRVFMVYDAKKIKAADAVKDWQQLANDKSLKGKYIVPKGLGGATANAVVYNILMNYQDKSAKMGISKEGFEVLNKFFKNGTNATDGQSEVGEIANGVADYAYTWLSNVPLLEDKLGIKLGIVNPPYGVPQTVEQVGIIKKDKMKSQAKDFVDFLGSAELQRGWSEKFGSAPVNKEAQSSVNPSIKKILETTTPQANDYDFISQHLDAWTEYIELNLLGAK